MTATDSLPGGFSFVSATLQSDGATRTADLNPGVGATSVSWGSWDIQPGGYVLITFVVDVPAGTTPGVFDNTAMANSIQTGLIV